MIREHGPLSAAVHAATVFGARVPPHRAYAELIEEGLRLGKAVVVVWSADAFKAHGVWMNEHHLKLFPEGIGLADRNRRPRTSGA